jgi:hypothetical protein
MATAEAEPDGAGAILEPERVLVLRSDDGNWVWAFVPSGGERLVSRNRIARPGASRLLLRIKRRAREFGREP